MTKNWKFGLFACFLVCILSISIFSYANEKQSREDKNKPVKLTTNPAIDSHPTLSPNDDKMAFASDRDGNREIYLMYSDKTQTRLTDNPADDLYPSWSPNADLIAFQTNRDGNWEIYVMRSDGSNKINLTNNKSNDKYPSWSSDGKAIVFVSDRDGNPDIFVIDVSSRIVEFSGLDSRTKIDITNDPVKGEDIALVTIIGFCDFQDPFCSKFFTEILPSIEENYIKTGVIKYVYKDFPSSSHNKHAKEASDAGQCAFEQGKFWEYHDAVYGTQNKLFKESQKLILESSENILSDKFNKLAVDIGLDAEKFNRCMASEKDSSEVQKDIDAAKKAGVYSTSTFFIGNDKHGYVMLKSPKSFGEFKTIIESEYDLWLETGYVYFETGHLTLEDYKIAIEIIKEDVEKSGKQGEEEKAWVDDAKFLLNHVEKKIQQSRRRSGCMGPCRTTGSIRG